MDKKKLQTMFRKFKKESGVAYAITNPDSFGDCPSCVNDALGEKYGIDSYGVWVKHWSRGMNAWKSLESLDSVYVSHDLNEELAEVFYRVMRAEYIIYPKKYDSNRCFQLFEKETEIYEVVFTDSEIGSTFADVYSAEGAEKRAKFLIGKGYAVTITKLEA